MKKFLLALVLFFALSAAAFAATSQKELDRMGIFISNFTEVGMFEFDLDEYGDDTAIHLGDPNNFGEFLYFGIMHAYINAPKSIKKCRDKTCEYGDLTVDSKTVINAVKKYFDVEIKPQSDLNRTPAIYYNKSDKLYHFEKPELPEPTYYAQVKNVKTSANGKIITMTGDIYNFNKKSERPATFTATAKPHKWQGKNTWAILSLTTEWR
ncbi:MAG: hypothetical protein II870_02305 [Synergistaceae bacterium]|nr:hypothetical protein [Synergistaceae bacterium]